jgi:beta-lactamase regulating signal transducer with metallopeptidase domain
MIGELTNHLWQSTLFAVAAALIATAFRKNRAHIRYWLWLSASLKFLVPFSFLMSLGSRLERAPAAKTMATQAVSFAVVKIAQPFSETSSFALTAPRTTDWLLIAILGAWVCGFGMIALIRCKDWLRIRSAVRSSTALGKISAAVEVRSSAGLLEPGVVGLLRPVLLLPAGIIDRLTRPQMEAVLAHELCHVRRQDNLTAAFHMIVEAAFWFHPLVWWITARLVEERERACDEEVLRLGTEPQVYAEGILNVCKFYLESPLTCISGVTGSDLKKRVGRIMSNDVGETLNGWRKLSLAIAGVAALAVPIVVGVLTETQPLTAQSGESKGRWITILDGKSLDNWNPIGDANWHLMGGAAVADAYDECLKQLMKLGCFNAGMGYLVSKSSYTDFEIYAEFWVSHDANSGVFIRCADPQNIRADNCYEANINDERPTYGTGAITNLIEPSIALKAGGKWNTYDITAHGPHLVLILNGTKTVDLQDSKYASGYIALQASGGTIRFRKVRVRSL